MLSYFSEWMLRIIFVGTSPTLVVLLGVHFGINKALIVVMAVIFANFFAFVEESQRRSRWVFRRKGEQFD